MRFGKGDTDHTCPPVAIVRRERKMEKGLIFSSHAFQVFGKGSRNDVNTDVKAKNVIHQTLHFVALTVTRVQKLEKSLILFSPCVSRVWEKCKE